MRTSFAFVAATLFAVAAGAVASASDKPNDSDKLKIHLGPRPFYLVDGMDAGLLKWKLSKCKDDKMHATDFSIGHRGACLQLPEHSKESYQAAARMGAGIVECDVTFTSDGELVCRHSECDLHTTLMTVRESIQLNESNDVKHTPELKAGDPARIAAVFGGQEQYAQELVNVLEEEDVDPDDVWLQSFNPSR
jgi:glycerophosphoryl diester phosphodiesterase